MAGFMTGRGARLALFIGGAKAPPLEVESWDLAEEAEIISDGVNGEDRDRNDKEIKGYKLTCKCFNATVEKLKALLQYDASIDANAKPAVNFGLKLTDKNGNSDVFALSECTIGDWKWSSGGRTARQMLDVPIAARYFKPLAP